MINTRKTASYRKQKPPKNNAGFYIALAICIVTVAAAAWTTYGSMTENSDITDESLSTSEMPVDNNVSGEEYSDDPSSTESENTASQESADAASDNTEENTESSGNTDNELMNINTEVQSSEEEMHFPVDNGEIVKKFSLTELMYSKTTSDWRIHRGIDISASEGMPVHAISSGTVKSVYKDALLGNVICIAHDGFEAYYCGVTDASVVSDGYVVDGGDTIGYVGTVPCEMSDESHIHLEIKTNNKYSDPAKIINNEY